jgi:DOPA 4,5-dioxygenase
MESQNPSSIESWHAHVYFDASRREAAQALRAIIETEMAGRMELGRFHEKPVGPHPMRSYQLAFSPAQFPWIVSWLALNHGALDVFIHPNTGDELRRQGVTSVQEALRMVPGFHVAQWRTQGWDVASRGFTNTRSARTLTAPAAAQCSANPPW